MYTDKYFKYKNKYFQLKSKLGGSASVNPPLQMLPVAIRIAQDCDGCPIVIEEGLSYCGMCDDTISINDFIILRCGCCIHYKCLFRELHERASRISLTVHDGIKCINNNITRSGGIRNALNSVNPCRGYQMGEPIRNEDGSPNISDINITPADIREIIDLLNDTLAVTDYMVNGTDVREIPNRLDDLLHPQSYEADEAVNGEYITLTTKPCPNCGYRVERSHGHECHHISPGGGCPRCQTHFCFVCFSTYAQNAAAGRANHECLCTWKVDMVRRRDPAIILDMLKNDTRTYVWGVGYVNDTYLNFDFDRTTGRAIGGPAPAYRGRIDASISMNSFCCSTISPEDIIIERGIRRDRRCGCTFCSDCRPGQACALMRATNPNAAKACYCLVCEGIVQPNGTELSDDPNIGIGIIMKLNIEIDGFIDPYPDRATADAAALAAGRSNRPLYKIKDRNALLVLLRQHGVNNENDLSSIRSIRFKNINFGALTYDLFRCTNTVNGRTNITELRFDSCKMSFHRDFFSNNNFSSLTTFTVINCPGINSIPSNLYTIDLLRTLIFKRTSITTIGRLPLLLENIDLSNNDKLTSFSDENNFNQLNHLSTLTIMQSAINDVFLNQLAIYIPDLGNLELLNLAGNLSITSIPQIINSNSLRIINFNGCRRINTVLQANTFYRLQSLSRITMDNTRIRGIETNAFNNLPMIRTISMHHNSIEFIRRHSFNDCRRLNQVNIVTDDRYVVDNFVIDSPYHHNTQLLNIIQSPRQRRLSRL